MISSVATVTRLASKPTAPVQKRGVDDAINFAGIAAVDTGIAAAASWLAPAGEGAKHLVGVAGFGVLAGLGGAVVGGWLGDKVADFAERVSNVHDSPDVKEGTPIMGMVTGALTGFGAAVAGGLGANPGITALVAGGIIVVLGAGCGIASHFSK